MNLILQGLSPDTATVDRIAGLADCTRIARIGAGVFRCENASLPDSARAEFDAACFAAQLDYAFNEGRSLSDFRLLAMDMDSTLITIECIDEIADMHGIKHQVAEITEAAMRGELEFRESLAQRVALLEGLDASLLQQVADERLRLSPGAERLLSVVRQAGIRTLLVSGGFTFFTDQLKSRLGLDIAQANRLDIKNGVLTGKVLGDIVDAAEKRRAVERACVQFGCSPSQALVMGDGANDLDMMGIAGLSVAFRAKPVVRKQATIALNFVGLDGILNILDN